MIDDICPVSGETSKEEKMNQMTHLIGLLFSLIGFPFLILNSTFKGDSWHVASCTIYGITLILLYFASSLYHGCKKRNHKELLKIFDHACIYLLIAGSYTPFTLGPLRETTGWALFIIIWSIAFVGISFKIIAIDRFETFSLLSYLFMGWLVVAYWPSLIEKLSFNTLFLISLGGILYSLGTLFFAWKAFRFNHAIWHLFVLGGSSCHYFAVVMLLPKA